MSVGLRLKVVFFLDFEDGTLRLVREEIQSHLFVLFLKLIGTFVVAHGQCVLDEETIHRSHGFGLALHRFYRVEHLRLIILQ